MFTVSSWKNRVFRLKILYRAQESAWHQKSRIQWCKLGDKNTRFFHLAATTRQKKNQLTCLEVDGQILSKPIDVKLAVFHFCRNLYSHQNRPRASCSNLEFSRLKPSSSAALELPFSAEEIQQLCGIVMEIKLQVLMVLTSFSSRKHGTL